VTPTLDAPPDAADRREVPVVTLDDLEDLGACEEGLADFLRAFPSGEASLAEALASDVRERVGWYAANTYDEAAMRFLATADDPNVRWAVAENPDVPQDVLEALASDPDPGVREAAEDELHRRARM
jgi:hypothetical protein